MYDSTKYAYDTEDHKAKICAGALLYRLGSINYSQRDALISGQTGVKSGRVGRWNFPQQSASYCSNNVLVCIAEVIYHLYRDVLDMFNVPNMSLADIIAKSKQIRMLSVFTVNEIDKMVYANASVLPSHYLGSVDPHNAARPRVTGTTLINPDVEYLPLREFNTAVREDKQRGIVYPSARHSKDDCFVFFHDETNSLNGDVFEQLEVSVHLVGEEQEWGSLPYKMSMVDDRIYPSGGYYSIADNKRFEDLKAEGKINPIDMPASGVLDIVRRRYRKYPADAIHQT